MFTTWAVRADRAASPATTRVSASTPIEICLFIFHLLSKWVYDVGEGPGRLPLPPLEDVTAGGPSPVIGSCCPSCSAAPFRRKRGVRPSGQRGVHKHLDLEVVPQAGPLVDVLRVDGLRAGVPVHQAVIVVVDAVEGVLVQEGGAVRV